MGWSGKKIMKKKNKKDLEKVAKRESLFSTLANKEGIEASKRAKKESKLGYKESAKDSRREAIVDKEFALLRRKIAQREKGKLNNG